MSDNPENPQQTPMDRKVDQRLEPTVPTHEKYNPTALGNLPLADSPEPLPEQDPTKAASWTIAEIERTLASNVLKPSSLKIDQFTQSVGRKQDLRLRNLSRQLGDAIRQDQAATDPAKAKKLTDFDLQSQTMRMVSANASMGSYQFQKTLVLPYMRKSLALGYQKVSLLKEIVKAISSSEKSMVSKLEAIKINTSSAAPRQKSYFKRLMDDVGFLNMRRVAGNLSAYTMDGYEKLYRKYVSPKTMKIHRMMSSERKDDGINGVRRTLTGKLNSWRRSTRDYAGQDFSDKGRLDKIKGKAASVVSRILGSSVKSTQQVKLGETRNRSLSSLLRGPIEDIAKFNPFSSKGPIDLDLEDDGIRAGVTNIAGVTDAPKLNTSINDTSLHKILLDWRAESRNTQDKVILHLSRIDDGINGRQTRLSRTRPRVSPISPISGTSRSMRSSTSDVMSSLDVPSEPKSLSDQLSGVLRSDTSTTETSTTPASRDRSRTSIGGKLSMMRSAATKEFGSIFQKLAAPLYQSKIMTQAAPTVVTAPMGDAKLDRSFFARMFDTLGNKVTDVSKTVDTGNQERTRFEKIQSKWKELADKLRPKEIRKNSYEDVKANRDGRPRGLLGRTADRFKSTATSVGSKLLSGDIIGAGGDLVSDAFGWAKDEIGDSIGDSLRDKAEEKLSRTGRRGRLLQRRTARGLRARGGIKGIAGKVLGIGGAPEITTGRNTLGKKIGSLAWRGTKATVKGGSSLLWKGTKGVASLGLKGAGALAKGGFSIAKSVAPSAAVGLAGGYLKDYFEKNSTGTTKRLGTTAGTMAQWGAAGATIGSIIPGLGTGVGATIGAGLGAIAANTDLVSSGLSKLGKAVSASGDTMWTSIFGKDAKFDAWGKVKSQEERSLIGNMYGSIFGQDAKYAKSGDLVRPGKKGLIPGLYQGVDKFFFGDKNKDGKFKAGTSILAMMSDKVSSSLDDFKNSMSQLPGQILELFGSLKEQAGSLYDRGRDAVAGAWNSVTSTVGNVFKGKGTPVSDAKSIVQELVPEARVTSHKRSAGQAGKAGNDSWHVKSGAAVDVAPVQGMDFETFKRRFTDAGYPLIEAIDETDPATMKKTGATGKHWHIVLGQRTAAPNANAGYQGPNGGATWGGAMSQNGPDGGTGPMKGGYVSKDTKQLFNQAVNYLTQKKGWSKTAAMGIVTNLFGESGLKTNAMNSAGGGQGAQGIAQWRGPRIKDIEGKFKKKISEMSLYEQLDAVDWELRDGKHITNSNSIANGGGSIVDSLNNAPNMASAVEQMVYRYERPSTDPSKLAAETRKRVNQGYGLTGAMGQNTPIVKPKASTAQQTTAPKTTTKKTEQTAQKSKLPPKPTTTPKTAPSPVVDTTFVDKFSGVLDKWEKTLNTSGSGGDNNTVISTPVSIANRTSSNNNLSLKKERIRTGA